MCLGIPGKLEKLKGTKGIISYGGAKREVDLSLIEDPRIGEYVIVHAGFAIEKLDEAAAKETLRLFEELLSSSP
ncbi:MAG: HypC/HybG/HupF family hydrogenase formation chaperone [Candidatus Heimdallarchaeota archaeon]